jgi:hypothetical protein
MTNHDFYKQLDQCAEHADAEARFDYLSEHLNKYFEKIYMSVTHPYSVVLGIELILQNAELCTARMFDTLTGRRGLSAMESYRIEAEHFADMTIIGHGIHAHRPFWRVEGDALRRWAPNRGFPYTFHEAFWMAFLGRYCVVSKSKIELLVFESLEVYKRRLDPDTCRIDPQATFSKTVFDALAGMHLDMYEPLPLDSFMLDHSQKVLKRLGR